MNLLQKRISSASQKYYSDGSSDISDEEFDSLLDELRDQDPNDPLLTQVGHGYSVSQDKTPGKKYRHMYGTAGSLPKCHNNEEIFRLLPGLMDDPSFYTSLKLDGISIVLYYTSGKLQLALTRGDGSTGIDVTDKIVKIDSNLCSCADAAFTGAVRGEILMSFANFEKYSELHPDAKNPRNTTAGLIGGKELTDDLKFLSIIVYNVVGCSHGISYKFTTFLENIEWLSANFHNVVPCRLISMFNNDVDLLMYDLRKEWYDIYPADGIVISKNKLNHSWVKVSPDEDSVCISYDSAAYKFPSEVKSTFVKDVAWELSKTKYLIPRINFDTIELAGTSVSWCHGDNAQNIINRRIGKGAQITVTKSGEIIPHMLDVLVEGEPDIPTTCPCCGSLLEWKGVHLACVNENCSDGKLQDLLVWSSLISPYMGIGDQLKVKFFEIVLDSEDLSIEKVYEVGPYKLNEKESQSVQMANFVDMYNSLFTNQVDLVTALRALNVPRISDVNAKKLAKFPDIVKELMDGKVRSLDNSTLKGIGEANWESVKSNLRKFERLKFIENQIDFSAPSDTEQSQKVAITGKLSMKRSDFEKLLAENGFKVVSSISKDTFALITDDPDSGTSKNKQADKLGVPKITEADFVSNYIK